jgi:hypothetical protein
LPPTLQEVELTAGVDREVDKRYRRRPIMRRLHGGVSDDAYVQTISPEEIRHRGLITNSHTHQAAWHHWSALNRVRWEALTETFKKYQYLAWIVPKVRTLFCWSPMHTVELFFYLPTVPECVA